jgi:LuxR family maltose regulon positive regulatory protein
VERAGLFLMPLDEVRGWWRYHHLFADLLRARLQDQPGRAAGRHRKAAGWFREHGLANDAIRHALAAGEMLWAARLIEEDFDTAYNLRGEGETIQRWLAALPADLVRSRPRLLLAQAQLRGTSGHLADMGQLLDAAERVSANGAGESFEPTAGPAASLLVNVPAHIALERAYLAQLRGDAEGTATFASRALAESRAGESMLTSTVQGFLAVAEWLRGRLTEAEAAFASGVAGCARRACPPTPPGADIRSPGSSAVRAAWMRPSGPASRPGGRRDGRPTCPAHRRARLCGSG